MDLFLRNMVAKAGKKKKAKKLVKKINRILKQLASYEVMVYRVISRFKADKTLSVAVIKWLPQIPDMNPIENNMRDNAKQESPKY